MPSPKPRNSRRRTYLSLIGEIENGLRDAYALRYEQGRDTQASLAKKLDVDRSVVHHRLTGRKNLTVQTIADMVWALDHAIKVTIYDPSQSGANHFIPYETAPVPATTAVSATAATPLAATNQGLPESIVKHVTMATA